MRKIILLVLGGIIIFGIGLFTGFFFGQNNKLTAQKGSETTTWKTYIDSEMGFSFDYPADTKITGQGPIGSKDQPNTTIGKSVSVSGKGLDMSINVTTSQLDTASGNRIRIVSFGENAWKSSYLYPNDAHGQCALGGPGPCTLITISSIIDNKHITFYFRNTKNSIIPEQIVSSFVFRD